MRKTHCFALFLLLTAAGAFATPPETPVSSQLGRRAFLDTETISLVLPAADGKAEVRLQAPDNSVFTVSAPAFGDAAYLDLPPFSLTPGTWVVASGDAELKFDVVSALPNTHFRHGVFAAGSLVNKPNAVRKMGWNTLQAFPSRHMPPPAADIDNIIRAGCRFTTINSVSAGHQPDNKNKSCWSHPDIVASTPYLVKHFALALRPYPNFEGIHYADEPGLAWVLNSRTYRGPLGVPCQLSEYERRTGRKTPDLFKPDADLEGWMTFMRWRSRLMGETFAAYRKAIKQVDPSFFAYTQFYEWAAATDGVYPPATLDTLDVISTHAYADRQISVWYPAHEVDALRMGQLNKPMWMMPTFMNLQPSDCLKGIVYATLARKVEGLLWGLNWGLMWPETYGIMQRILPVSDVLYYAEKRSEAVGLFYSQDQLFYGFSRNPYDYKGGREHVGALYSAWLLANATHLGASYVAEEDVLDGTVNRHKVLIVPHLNYARPEVLDGLKRYIAKGGVIFTDNTTTVTIEGAKSLGFPLSEFYYIEKLTPGATRFPEKISPHIEAFAAALTPYVKPDIACDNPEFMTSIQNAGNGRYAWVVNMVQNGPGRWAPAPGSATVTLPESPAIYDVFARKRIDNRTLKLDLAAGDACLYALLPDAVNRIELTRADWEPPYLKVSGRIIGDGGKPIDALVPFTIAVTRPGKAPDDLFSMGTGRENFLTLHRVFRGGTFEETIPLGHSAVAGIWDVNITENLSGKTVKKEWDVKRAAVIKGLCTSAVDTADGDRIAKALVPDKGEVLVLHGEGDSVEAAKRIAAALKEKGLNARADNASNYNEFAPTTQDTYFMKKIVPLMIRKQVVLVGCQENNPLIARLTGPWWLSPRTLSAHYPGVGRALLFWEQGMFGMDNDIVVVYAQDAKGLERGAGALATLLEGKNRKTFELEMKQTEAALKL